jgi:hypothetical protein
VQGKSRPFWFFTALFIVMGIITASLSNGARAAQFQAADTPTSTPFPARNMVISEFRTRGPNGANDEFIELYNPTGAAVNISSWTLRRSTDCGPAVNSAFVTITSNTILLAGEHYLLRSSRDSSINTYDQVYSPVLTDAGGLALVDLAGNIVDQVGMCNSTQYREGTNLVPLDQDANQSYERLPGGATACYDTGSNAGDFDLISPSNPQDNSAPVVLCQGVTTYTPTRTPTNTPTRTPTRTPTTIPGFVVINEFLPHPHSDWNEDGLVNVNDEYIELMNLSTSPVNIRNWKLDNGANTRAYALPDVSMLPHQIMVFFRFTTNIPLSDGGGTVRLVKSDGRTADLFNYPPVEAMDETWCRMYSGTGFLTFDCQPSPGRPNVLLNPTPVATVTGTQAVVKPGCNLSDIVPPSVILGECGQTGEDIWQTPPATPLVFPPIWKWPAIIE